MKEHFKKLGLYFKNNKVKSILILVVLLICFIFSWESALIILIILGGYYFYKTKDKTKNITESIKKICPHCKEEINKEASRCPHCHGKIYVWTSGRKVIIGFAILSVFLLVITESSNKPSTPSNQSTQNQREIEALVFAKDVIKRTLKAPSTATFEDVHAYELSNLKDVWAVNGYVDSQNSYGAKLRNVWEVQLDYRDGKGGTVKSVMLDGKQLQ